MDFILVTPVLDGWPRIRATVASVRAQTTADIPSDFRIRHVVQLSDRSTDPSGEWLRQQSGVEVRVESDTGLYDAIARGFQAGLASLDGEGQRETVLSWLNADEQWLPDAVADENYPGHGRGAM